MCEYVISLDNVSCKAGHRHLLKDISWNVKAGEHWVVFGMNGSGKTTLLSIIAGFKHFTKGEIKIFGETLTNDNILSMRKRVGWVSSSFFDRFYAKESVLNIILSGKFGTLGIDEGITLTDVALAKDLLAELNLGNKVDRSYDMLSKGERQNVLIARALFAKPDILILDEPCSGLDVYNRSYLFSTIEALSQKQEMTLIYVTHYAEEIIPLFDKVLLLKKGHIFAKGDIKTLFTSETIQSLLGYPVKVAYQNEQYHFSVETHSRLTDFLMAGEQL